MNKESTFNSVLRTLIATALLTSSSFALAKLPNESVDILSDAISDSLITLMVMVGLAMPPVLVFYFVCRNDDDSTGSGDTTGSQIQTKQVDVEKTVESSEKQKDVGGVRSHPKRKVAIE